MALGRFGGETERVPRQFGGGSPGGIGVSGNEKPLPEQARDQLKESPEGAYTIGRVVIGTFSRDVSTATGTQTISGLGGIPYAIFVQGIMPVSTGQLSMGYSNGTNNNCVWDAFRTTADTYDHINTTQCIYIDQGAVDFYRGSISLPTDGTDGFIISWTKNGNPTGTWQGKFMAFLRG